MNDDFIYKVLPKVSQKFGQSLYKRISANPVIPLQRRGLTAIYNHRLGKVALIVMSAVLIVAWSQLVVWIRWVPIGDLWLVEISHQTQNTTGIQRPAGPIPTPGRLPTIIVNGVEMETWRMDYLSPSWIPEGFSATEIPAEMISYETTIGMWSNGASERIRLFTVPRPGGMHPYAQAGNYKEIQVNGEPAILIQGHFALTSKENPPVLLTWDDSLGLQLHWMVGESVYALETFGNYMSEQDLIRMAESMKSVPWNPPAFRGPSESDSLRP